MAGKYRLTTLGCKVNQCESQQVRQLLESAGFRPAKSGQRADVAVVNTCAVTCSATAKSRQSLRKLAKSADRTIAIGCYATAEPDQVGKIDGVTGVFGHDDNALAGIRDLVARISSTRPPANGFRKRANEATTPLADSPSGGPLEDAGQHDAAQALVQVGMALSSPDYPASLESTNINSIRVRPGEVKPGRADVTDGVVLSQPLEIGEQAFVTPIREFAGRTRAFLKIQDGCDASCTYCIIPKLRTTLRSKPIAEAAAEARALVAAGHKEIVLTGIFLGAYGRETAIRRRFVRNESPLAALVDALAGVEGLERLRLSSLEPGDMDDELLSAITRHSSCVPHFHLPLQSGSGEILRRMNRQYTVDAFVDMIDRVNAALDRPAITTDVIVGFPGETDAMFEQMLTVARYAGFCKIHAFPFSPRPGTAAVRWKDQYVHQQTVKDRMSALAELETELARHYVSQFVGQTQRVLVESRSSQNTDGAPLAHGRTDRYFEVWFESSAAQPGDLVNVRIDRVTPTRTHGTVTTIPQL